MDIFAPLAGRMGMQWMREELEDLAFRRAQPRGALVDHPPVHHAAEGNRRRDPQDHRTTSGCRAGKGGRRGRGDRPGQEALFDLAQDAGKGAGLFAALRHLRVSRDLPEDRRGLLSHRSVRSTSAGARCRGGSRTTSASRNRTATDRSTPPSRAAMANGSRCRSAPGRCTMSPKPASPRIGPIATACRARTRLRSIRRNGCVADRTVRSTPTPRRVSRTREAGDVFRPGVLLFAQGRRGETAARRDAAGFRLCDPHPDRRLDRVGAKIDGIRVPLWTRLKNGQSVEIITARASVRRPRGWTSSSPAAPIGDPPRPCARKTANAYVKLGSELARVAFEHVRQGHRQRR